MMVLALEFEVHLSSHMRTFICASPFLFDRIRNCANQCKQARTTPHRTAPHCTGCNSSSVNTVMHGEDLSQLSIFTAAVQPGRGWTQKKLRILQFNSVLKTDIDFLLQ